MNLYRYCGNSPLNWLDPFGLAKVAFYDGGDPGGLFLNGGREFEEMADDFDYHFDLRNAYSLNMSPEDYILDILKTWNACHPNDPITDIYIYDHADCNYAPSGSCTAGIQLGDKLLLYDTDELANVLKSWGTVTGPNTVFHFRGCNIAKGDSNKDRKFLKYLAKNLGRNTTACEGSVQMIPFIWNIIERPGPDYDFGGRVYMATPSGTTSMYEHAWWEIWDWLGPRKY